MLRSFMAVLAKPLPALTSIATIAGLYVAWLSVQEAQLTRTDQHQQFLAEKSPRLTPTRIYINEYHLMIELKNEGESEAQHVGVAKGFIRPNGSSVSDWEFTPTEETIKKDETARLYVTDIDTAKAILGYAPKEFEPKRYAKPQPHAGILQIAINYQDAFGNSKRREAEFVARP